MPRYAGNKKGTKAEALPILVVTKNQAHDHRVLICDRDATWSVPVRERLGDAGIRVVQTPFQAPNANAYAERFVRSWSRKEEMLCRPDGRTSARTMDVGEAAAPYTTLRGRGGKQGFIFG